jgi:hypothetical protein
MKKEFYWDSETINYYAEFNYLNGWASTAMKIYEYVADECDWDGEEDFRSLYSDLLDQVEDKILTEGLD